MTRLQQFLAPLSTPEKADVLRAWSDLESGSPRQWLLLEMAATLGAGHASWRTRLMAWLTRSLGIAVAWPLLAYWNLPGTALYQANARVLGRCARQTLDDAALLLASLTALLAGLNSLPASRQFVASLLLLLGGAVKYWRVCRQHRVEVEAEASGEEILPGAEATLGLQGLLFARGLPPREALALCTQLKTAPHATLPALLAALPELRPPAPARGEFLRIALFLWALAILPALWLNSWEWGWIIAILWALTLARFSHRSKIFPALILAVAASVYLVASLIHAW